MEILQRDVKERSVVTMAPAGCRNNKRWHLVSFVGNAVGFVTWSTVRRQTRSVRSLSWHRDCGAVKRAGTADIGGTRPTYRSRWASGDAMSTVGAAGQPSAVASPSMGHWGTCPLGFQQFHF